MAGGRPRLYNSAEEVQEIVDKYFAELDDEIPTMAGLALELGMSSRSLRNYAKEQEFFPTIKAARQKVEKAWESALIRGGSGPIFWLKNNAGWRDKTERDVNHGGEVKVSAVSYEVIDPKSSSS
jgi:hypothetical protein